MTKKEKILQNINADGYTGDRAHVVLYFDHTSGHTLAVHATGYFNIGLGPSLTMAEALWRVEHHPCAGRIKVLSVN